MSDNPNSGFYEADTARTIDTSNQSPCKNQGGMVVIEGNGSRPSHHGDGYKESQTMYTLNCTENHAVSYGIGRPAMNQGYNARFSFQIVGIMHINVDYMQEFLNLILKRMNTLKTSQFYLIKI